MTITIFIGRLPELTCTHPMRILHSYIVRDISLTLTRFLKLSIASTQSKKLKHCSA